MYPDGPPRPAGAAARPSTCASRPTTRDHRSGRPAARGLPGRGASAAAGRLPRTTSTTTSARIPVKPPRIPAHARRPREQSRDAVLVYHLDRLHRQPRELEEFLDLCVRTVSALACVTGEVDLATHEGSSTHVSSAPWRARRAKTRAGAFDASTGVAARGRTSGGGTRPYGYAADRITVIPEEADVSRNSPSASSRGESPVGRPPTSTSAASAPSPGASGRRTASARCSSALASADNESTTARSSARPRGQQSSPRRRPPASARCSMTRNAAPIGWPASTCSLGCSVAVHAAPPWSPGRVRITDVAMSARGILDAAGAADLHPRRRR